jgi:ribulose-bisphosphate carboxylase small chain
MRITQGTFSFLPDLTDEQIELQIKYALRQGWAIIVEHTDDPHHRNPYWEMWSQPSLDLDEEESHIPMQDVNACREAFPNQYVKVVCYDRGLGTQTSRLAFIVNRPEEEPGYRLERTEVNDRVINYTIHPYASDMPAGQRYGAEGIPGMASKLVSEGDAPASEDGGDPEAASGGESEASEEA